MDADRGWLRHPGTWVLAALLAVRAALALTLELGRDEAAYWYWAWHGPDASYSLVTGLAVRASTALLGDSPPAVRLPAVIAGALSVVALVAACRRAGTGRSAALAGGVALAAAPAASLAGTIVHPDAFLLLFAVLFAERAAAVAREGPGRGRLAGAAAAAALAALSKLPGALFLLPAAFLVARHRGDRAALPAGAVLVAAAAVLGAGADPDLLRGVREFGRFAPGLTAGDRAILLAAELVAWCGPALLLAGAAGAIALRRPEARTAWPAWSAAALLLAFFAGFAAAGQAKANWFLPGLALLVPPAVRQAEAAGRLAPLRAAGAGSALLALAVAGALALPARPDLWNRVAGGDRARQAAGLYTGHVGDREAQVSPTRSWVERAEEFRERPGDDPRVAGAGILAGPDYGLAFRIAHAVGRRTRVLLPWDPVFARSCGGDLEPGADVLFVSSGAAPPADWAALFREVEELPPGPAASGPAAPFRAWSCRSWTGAEPVAARSRPEAEGEGTMQAFRGRAQRLAVLPATLIAAWLAAPSAGLADGEGESKRGFDHSAFDRLLAEYVAPDGVRYRAWAAHDEDRKALDEYVARLAEGRPSALPSPDALAFWIDAYNALTLKLILDHYPLESIKDIGSPWKRKLIGVEGRELSLDEIENDVIRRQWDEPRIHFALNCAAVSCPPLRAGAYTGAGLDAQLEEQTRAFLSDSATNRLDADGKLHLSKIFQWYGEDFEGDGTSLVDWLLPHFPELPVDRAPRIEFGGYDWDLNEAAAGDAAREEP